MEFEDTARANRFSDGISLDIERPKRKIRLKTKASNEMLIRRRVDTIKALVDEYGIALDIELVRSECTQQYILPRNYIYTIKIE